MDWDSTLNCGDISASDSCRTDSTVFFVLSGYSTLNCSDVLLAPLGLVEEFFTPHCPIPFRDHSHETANGNHNPTVKKLQGICQVADWVFATAQGPKSMFR
jgi:hypothetical protein